MKTIAPTLLLLLACAGCVSNVNTLEPAQPTAQAAVVADKRVISNPDLESAVHVLAVHTSTQPQGFFRVDLQVQNATSSRQSFSYRFDWVDQNGLAIELPTEVALPMTLEGRETTTIGAIAPTPLARDFRVTFFPPAQ